MSRLRIAAVGAAALLALGITIADWPAGFVLAVVAALLLVAARWMARPGTHRELQAILMVALLLRVGLAVGVQWGAPIASRVPSLLSDQKLTNKSGHMGFTLFWDEWKYEDVAWGIAQYWMTTPIPPTDGQWHLLLPADHVLDTGRAFGMKPKFISQYLMPHVYLTAGLYTALGRSPLADRIIQAGLGALVVGLIYALAQRWVGRRAAAIAGVAAVVEPSLVFWSPWILKDMAVVALVGLVLLSALSVVQRVSVGNLAVLVGSFLLLVGERGPVAVYVGLLVPLAAVTVARNKRHTLTVGAALLLLTGSLLWVGGRGFLGTSNLNVRLPVALLQYREKVAAEDPRTGIQFGDSTLDEAVKRPTGAPKAPTLSDAESMSTGVGRNLMLLPIGLLHVMAAPFVWDVQTTKDLLALLFLPLWYGGLVLAGVGLWVAWPDRKRLLLLPVVFFAATVLYFSLTETSVGNIIRHRIIMLLVLLPLASQGGLSLWSRLRSMRTARTQRSLVTSPSPG